ncbi:trichohyalin [Lucilia sericata]|uniref:trichohyalin n=1 Tax=Lucilia sericata TaxID=13632 RepID=UPI0018A81183|nr:trichohyalin [Lucilia sericata]
MNELQQLTDHHAFIVRTDRKSLYTQIKNLVHQAQEVASKELNQRRNTLKLLLEYEDKIYEEEFANKVKSRIDEDIRERKDILLKIKEESTKNELEFLKSKRIQQYMNSCYEIREALRRKETQNVKECQLEQMLEKERSVKKEQDLEKYWLEVQNINLRLMDERQQQENCLKKALVKHVSDTRKVQLEELQEQREKELEEKLEEKKNLDALLEEIRLEEFDQKLQGKPAQVAEYRNELLKMINEKQEAEKKERRELADMHRKMMAEIASLEAAENAAAKEKKKAFHKATLDFIRFVKDMRQLEERHEQVFNERTEDLRRIDMCTKNNILRERQRKARLAEKCYAELRQQICEQYENRLREEAEHRECKMLENRFIHREITRQEILERKQKNRIELEKQMEELKKLREIEQAHFSNDLKRASNDQEFCAELAKQYIKEGIDYLEPHPNWRIIACSSKEYVTKAPARNLQELLSQGAIPKKCIKPCGCMNRGIKKTAMDGRGDEIF